VLSRALSIDPADRYETADVFAKELRVALVESKHGVRDPDAIPTLED
jgi:hypothetical protein